MPYMTPPPTKKESAQARAKGSEIVSRTAAILVLSLVATATLHGQEKPTITAVDKNAVVVQKPLNSVTTTEATKMLPVAAKPCLPRLGEMSSVMSSVDFLTVDKVAWSEASADILGVIESIRPLTATESTLLKQLEVGKTDQQKFSGRLNLLKQLVRP